MTVPGLAPNQWLIQEDNALKIKLSGFVVTNYADGRKIPIAVYFRFPDTEERKRTFPHFAIDMVDIDFDHSRAHRALEQILTFDLEQATPQPPQYLVADDMPLPWTLVYQIVSYARQPWHDRQMAALMYQMFPEQYGNLNMAQFDGTIRRADLMSVVRRDMMDNDQKRLYRQIFTVGISSEFYVNELQLVAQAKQIDLTVALTNTNVSEALVVT
jgi:hypothetical protein